jgi:enamine deaminase RidA (YjgF/YER057c/UK114 family)
MLKSITVVTILIALSASLTLGAEKKVILPKGAQPNAGWSYGILPEGTLYVSGMGGEDAADKIPASFEAEVKQSLDNINAILKEAGMTPSDIVSIQVYLPMVHCSIA